MESLFAKGGKSVVRFEIFRYSNSTFSKITDLNFSVEVWTDGGKSFCVC